MNSLIPAPLLHSILDLGWGSYFLWGKCYFYAFSRICVSPVFSKHKWENTRLLENKVGLSLIPTVIECNGRIINCCYEGLGSASTSHIYASLEFVFSLKTLLQGNMVAKPAVHSDPFNAVTALWEILRNLAQCSPLRQRGPSGQCSVLPLWKS